MNALHFTRKHIAARFLAGITIMSLLLSALPVAFFIANAATQNVTVGVSMVPNPSVGNDTITLSNPKSYEITLEQLEVTDSASSFYGPTDLVIAANSSEIINATNRLNAAADDITFSGTNITSETVSYTGAPAADFAVTGSFSINADDGLPAGTVHNVDDNLYFATIQEAIDAATTGTGDTIELTADVTTTAQVTVDKAITLDGNGFTLDADFFKAAPSANDNNSAIGVQSDDVTIMDVVVTSSGDLPWPKQLHGINVYESTGVVLDGVSVSGLEGSGVVVNSSEVMISDITTANNGWNAINVDKKTSQDSQLTIKNTSVHGEISPITPHIYIDDTAKAAVVIDQDSQYDFADFGNARVYTLKQVVVVPKKVNICHFNPNGFNSIEVSVNSIANAHGNDTQDIIPMIPNIYPNGQNLVTNYNGSTGAEVLTDNCAVPAPDGDAPLMSNIKMFVERNGVYEESYVVRPGDNVRVAVDVEDDGSGVKNVEFRIQSLGGAYVAARTFVDTATSGDTYHFEYQVPTDGKYINTHGAMNQDIEGHVFWARATDNEGNYHNGLRGNFTFDTTLPEMANIKMFVKNSVGVYVESDIVEPGDHVRVEVEATDAAGDIRDVEFRIQAQDGQYVALRDYVATTTNGNTYRFEYQVPTDGKYVNTHNPMNEDIDGHTFWARATDEAGNYHHGLSGDFTFRTTVVVEPEDKCYLPYMVTFTEDSDDDIFSTTAGNGLVVEEIPGGYTIGLYDDGRAGVYTVAGTITFPVGTDTSTFAFSEPAGYEGLEQSNLLYTDVADRVGNTINFVFNVNGANDIFTITDATIESPANCTIEPPVLAAPYCGDGEINQWEQCELGDEGCTDYCTLDNQCSSMQLVKVTLDENTGGPSFDGMLYLGGEDKMIPNGTWFKFDEVGDQSYVTTANAAEGLAIERNQTSGKLALAFVGGNSSRQLDIASGQIITLGIDLGAVDRTPNPQFKLENGSGNSFDDVFEKTGETINFDLRADTGNDGVTVEVAQGAEYDCPECKATVEARIVLNDSGAAGDGDLSDEIILGDAAYSTVEFGEWFPVSIAANPGDSAVMITDPNTVTSFATPADKAGLFVSRENGTVKVAIYGEHNPGGAVNNEWIDARIEVRDAQITNFQKLSGLFKFEKHPASSIIPRIAGFDSAAVDNTGVDFKMWVDTASDGFKFDIETDSIAACVDDTIDVAPDPATLVITSPAAAGMVLAGTHNFTAEYNDDDEIEDSILWAIRAGTCAAGTGTVAGNVDGFSNTSTFVAPNFSAIVNMSDWLNGNYCFVVNPSEQSGEDNLRATQEFVLTNQVAPESDTYRIEGTKFQVEYEGELEVLTELAGWTMNLVNLQDVVLQSTTTDENGYYYFDIEAGDWTVEEGTQTDWTQVRAERNGSSVKPEEDGAARCYLSPGEYDYSYEENYVQFVSSELQEEQYTCDFYNEFTGTVDPDPEPEEEEERSSSRSSGTRTRNTPAPTGLVLGASTVNTCPFLLNYMQIGENNDALEVMKLQAFLNIFRTMFGGTENPVTGTFGVITDANVKAFQQHFQTEILDPWYNQGIVPHNRPTGFVYKTTLWKINSIVCPDTAVVPSLEGENLSSNVDNDIDEQIQD
jgi:hypothetical protein